MELDRAVKHLSQAIQFATVSKEQPADMNFDVFEEFIAFLESAFPVFHEKTTRTLINDYALLYRWPGKEDSSPALLTAHYDVVEANEKDWSFPPFAGLIEDDRVLGRGAIDDKASLIGLLEASTSLMDSGFIPRHDIYFAFGFDEEQGGQLGAKAIALHLKEQNIRFRFVLDEGGAVANGKMMGVTPRIAVIGLAEKGNTSYRFTFKGKGGHSASPPASTAIGKMAAFIRDVETHPRKPRLTDTVVSMLQAVAPYKSGFEGILLSKPKRFARLITRIMTKNSQTAPMLRTTVAFTMADGGSGHNILPPTASCVANIRVLQGDTLEEIRSWLESFGHTYEITPILENEATSVSSTDSEAWTLLNACIAEVFPDAFAVPYLMTGGTDCRHYEGVVDNSYRFSPYRLDPEDLAAVHGIDEAISFENLKNMIQFYKSFIQEL